MAALRCADGHLACHLACLLMGLMGRLLPSESRPCSRYGPRCRQLPYCLLLLMQPGVCGSWPRVSSLRLLVDGSRVATCHCELATLPPGLILSMQTNVWMRHSSRYSRRGESSPDIAPWQFKVAARFSISGDARDRCPGCHAPGPMGEIGQFFR